MLTTHLVLFSFYDGASDGTAPPPPAVFSGFTTIPPALAFFDGFSNSGTPPAPTPTPLPETDGGGPSSPLRDWRWYHGQELRPNWYEYPEERKRLKQAIKRVVRQKQQAQEELKKPQRFDAAAVVERLTELQQQLNYLLSAYTQMMGLLHAKNDADEEEKEYMELILMSEDL